MKKNVFFFVAFAFFSLAISVQNSVEVGDTFVINEVPGDNYKYIKFPKSNTVIKKGGIADYNLIVGKKV